MVRAGPRSREQSVLVAPAGGTGLGCQAHTFATEFLAIPRVIALSPRTKLDSPSLSANLKPIQFWSSAQPAAAGAGERAATVPPPPAFRKQSAGLLSATHLAPRMQLAWWLPDSARQAVWPALSRHCLLSLVAVVRHLSAALQPCWAGPAGSREQTAVPTVFPKQLAGLAAVAH